MSSNEWFPCALVLDFCFDFSHEDIDKGDSYFCTHGCPEGLTLALFRVNV